MIYQVLIQKGHGSNHVIIILIRMGGDLWGTGERYSQNSRWGTAHAFGEVLLLEAWQSTKRLKNGVKEEIFLWNRSFS